MNCRPKPPVNVVLKAAIRVDIRHTGAAVAPELPRNFAHLVPIEATRRRHVVDPHIINGHRASP